MPIDLNGNWKWGSAYDIHTIHSEHYIDENGNDRWDNTRSEMGELVYQLKYQHDKTTINNIINLLSQGYTGLDSVDLIVPAPPSQQRPFQPVFEICKALGDKVQVPVVYDLLIKAKNSHQLKNVNDPEERERLLKESMSISSKHTTNGKNVLLVDDLYRSGATLKVATDLLYSTANVQNVYVLTMTKTRSKR